MRSRKVLLSALLAGLSAAEITWAPCNETEVNPAIAPFQCANLTVPFDYTKSNSSETLELQLMRIPAPLGSKGSILTNPGGPGQSGRASIGQLAGTLVPLTGGTHDIIAFDTRGTENTIPFECTLDPVQQAMVYKAGVGANSSEGAIGTLWARGTIDAEQCARNASKIGAVMSSAFVARDMMEIVDALGEDGLLRYWGLSYGTTLGATVAAMFPDRMDKLILDGVQNPHEYYHEKGNIEEWTDTDAALSDLFTHCIKAGPQLCPLSAHNKSASALESMTWSLLDKVKTHPIPLGPMLIDYSGLKGYIQQTMYGMDNWPFLVQFLNYLLFGVEYENMIALVQATAGSLSTDPEMVETNRRAVMGLNGIYCGDNQVRTDSLRDFLPTIQKLYNTSRLSGDGPVGSFMLCQQWEIEPKEVYSGSFEASLKTPMLLIGNTLDSHTPLKSAHNVSAGFEGSVVLEVDGNGHALPSVPSLCAWEVTSAYWEDGTLPDEGTKCQRDREPFDSRGWFEVLSEGGVGEELLVYTAPAAGAGGSDAEE